MINYLDKTLLRILQVLLVSIVLVVSWQVISRYLLGSPSSFTEELARFLLIWITMLGTVYAYRHNAHLGLDLIYSQASPAIKQKMYIFAHLCVALFALLALTGGGWSLVALTYSLGQKSAVMGIDIALIYSVLPISGLWTCFYACLAIFNPEQPWQKDELQ